MSWSRGQDFELVKVLGLPPFVWENKEHEYDARKALAFTAGGLGAA